MIYLISDLHGCYNKWNKMLEKINFTNEDHIYVLGDIVDRGNEPIKLLSEISKMKNASCIIGNHERIFLNRIDGIPNNAKQNDFYKYISDTKSFEISCWTSQGGKYTFEQFLNLSESEKKEILDFINNMPSYIEMEFNGQKYLLSHSGIGSFSLDKALSDYDDLDFCQCRPNINDEYYEDRCVIYGHTPTFTMDEAKKGKIIKTKSFINIDCGVAFKRQGGALGCLRLDDMQEFYIA